MAHLTTSDGINLLNGALNKKKKKKHESITVTRVKAVKDPLTGEVMGHGPNEMYIQAQRNYNAHPLTPGETRQRGKWREACRLASVILKDKSHPLYATMYHRWREHVSTAETPMQFPNFVRSILQKEAQELQNGRTP